MLKIISVLTVIISLFSIPTVIVASESALQWKILMELDPYEPFEAQVFHSNVLWSGRSRNGLSSDYNLDVFDAKGNRLATEKLTHSPRFLYPFEANSVLAVGISYKTSNSHYTVASLVNGKVKLRSVHISPSALANEWAGKPGQLFFTDPGGLDDGSPMGTPLPTLFSLRNTTPSFLKARIRGPHKPVLVGKTLYTVEHPSIESGGRYVVSVPLDTQAPKRIFTGSDITDLKVTADGKSLVVIDRGNHEVIVLDITKTTPEMRFPLPSGSAPRAVSQLGHCAVVGWEGERKVSFIDLRTSKLLATWDLTAVGPKFTAIRNISMDTKTGAVFLRSATPGNPVGLESTERNSVVRVEDVSEKTRLACM